MQQESAMNNVTQENIEQAKNAKVDQELLQLVGFHLSGEEYGIDILKVQEIIRMLPITRVPNAPKSVEGVINLRGKVIPVMNLRNKFSMEDKQANKNTRIIVVNVGNKTLGVIVDSVSEVLRLSVDKVQPPPSVVTDNRSDYIKGIGKIGERLLILLDLDKIFAAEAADTRL